MHIQIGQKMEQVKKKRGAPNKPKHLLKVQQNFKMSPAVLDALRKANLGYYYAFKGKVTMSKLVEHAVISWYDLQKYVEEYNKREAAK